MIKYKLTQKDGDIGQLGEQKVLMCIFTLPVHGMPFWDPTYTLNLIFKYFASEIVLIIVKNRERTFKGCLWVK